MGDETQQQDQGEKKGLEAESDKLKGTWLLVEGMVAGKTVRPPKGDVSTYTFTKDNKLTVKTTGKPESQGTFKIDPAKTPMEIDFIHEAAMGRRKVDQGIYKIDGDNLTIAMEPSRPGANRPTTLDSKTAIIMTFKRQKP
jgi:uncharacterized protein (TIGR03067 family)